MKPTISLKFLLAMLLAAVFLLLGLALFLANLTSTRDFLQRQLASHAQDSASALALQLSDSLTQPSLSEAASTVDALFDSGYYLRIALIRPNGTQLLERSLATQEAGVPEWFVRVLPITAPSGQAEVDSAVNRALVQVTSRPGYAYQQLWITARNTLALMLLFWGLAALLGAALLARALAPLRLMEQLALKVAAGEFTHLGELPRIRELHHIAQSLNTMSDSVDRMLAEKSAMVQKLQADLYQDAHTGLANRAFFLAALTEVLHEHADSCGLILLQVDGLSTCNSRYGHETGDRLIRAVATAIAAKVHLPAEYIARIDGTQFGVMIDYTDTDTLSQLADKLVHAANTAMRQHDPEHCCSVHAGAALAEATDSAALIEGASYSSLLARADAALRDAKLGASGTSRLAVGTTHATSQLRDLLHQAALDTQLRIEWQPVLACSDASLEHFEAHARLVTPEGQTMPAGAFVYLAEETGLVTTLDRQILSDAWLAERSHPTAACAVNLSTDSLQDSTFTGWLKDFIRAPHQLFLEVPTHRLATAQAARQGLLDLRQAGFGIVLDRFVPQAHALASLNDIRPQWLKVEGSLCRQARDNVGTRTMLHALCSYAHDLGCKVGATGVEDQATQQILCELGFDATQGRLFNPLDYGAPVPRASAG